MTRRQLRECIFKILFKVEFNDIDDIREQMEYTLLQVIEPEDYDEDKEQKPLLPMSEPDYIYITDKVYDIINKLPEIDEILTDISEGWSIERMGKTEVSILRLAVYEIKHDDNIPESVAINEAVELSKIYCQDNARSFINGILAKVVK